MTTFNLPPLALKKLVRLEMWWGDAKCCGKGGPAPGGPGVAAMGPEMSFLGEETWSVFNTGLSHPSN